MSDGHQPYNGPLIFDLSSADGMLFDLPGGVRGLQREQPGIDEVTTELSTAVSGPAGVAAGIPADAYEAFVDAKEKLAVIRKHRAALAKIVEVLAESEALFEDAREKAVGRIVDAVKSAAKRQKKPSLLAPFEQAIAYNAQAANKAVKTRVKNAAAKKAAKSPPAP